MAQGIEEEAPRRADWRARLAAYVAAAATRTFQPGTHDCALFAAGAVEAITGRDLARGYRGYRSMRAGRAALADRGFASMADYAAAHLSEIPVLRAQVGDIAVLDENGGEAFGVVQGARIYVLRLDGLGTVALTDAKRAFRV